MKAAQLTTYGGPEVVTLTNTAPRPVPAEGQILVEVRAASLNPVDTVIRSGYMNAMLPLQFPATLGGDYAGVVTEAGAGVAGFAIGDRVYGQGLAPTVGTGTLAEFVATAQANSARKPATADYVTAASLPLVGSSALQALTDHLHVQRGQRILILGGAGGIGGLAVQLAKHLGAHVIATAFTDDVAYVKGLGADEVIDARTAAFEQVVRNVDGVFDTVGGEPNTKAYGVLRKGGVLVSMIAPVNEARMAVAGVTAITQSTQTTTERLRKLAELVDRGILRPDVNRVFPLEQAREAFVYRETSHPRGKVVVEVK